MYFLDGYNRDGDHSRVYLFNGYSDVRYRMCAAILQPEVESATFEMNAAYACTLSGSPHNVASYRRTVRLKDSAVCVCVCQYFHLYITCRPR